MGTRTVPMNFSIKWQRDIRAAVMVRDNFTCQECGWVATDIPDDYDGRYAIGAWPYSDERVLHLDHIVPRVAGGSSTPDNLQALCESCNCRKGAR